MPTILYINGWRIFFYSNENNEPIHVHAQKGDTEVKYWIKETAYDIEEANSYNLSAKDRREIRKLLFDHFEYIISKWDEFKRSKL